MSDEDKKHPSPHPQPPREGTPAPAPAPEKTLREDASAAAAKARSLVSPTHLAKNAALTATGVKPVADAANTGKDVAEGHSQAAANTSRPAPQPPATGGGKHAARPVQPTRAGVAAPDNRGGPQGGGRRVAAAPASGTGHGTNPPTPPASPVPGRHNNRPGAGATATAAAGAAGASGLAGAAKFAQRSDSTGGLTGDAKSVASGAKSGAAIGAKVGGGPVGAAVGAVAGGAVQGMKTKNGRRGLITVAALVASAPFIFMTALALMMSMIMSPSSFESTQNSADEIAAAAAVSDGFNAPAQRVATETASATGIPWEILAAIVHVTGGVANVDDAEPLTANEIRKAYDDSTPVGPYSFLPDVLDAQVVFSDENVPDAFLDSDDPIIGMFARAPRVRVGSHDDRMTWMRHLTDYRFSTDAMGVILAHKMSTAHPNLEHFGLGQGVILASSSDESLDVERVLDPGDNDDAYDDADALGPGTRFHDTEGDGGAQARTLRDAYVDVLATLPVEAAEENAEAIYDQALAWYLGQTKQCVPAGATNASGGMWANPIVASISSPFGMRFHPIHRIYKLHDGTDFGAAAGAPVHAGGSGTVTVLNEGWSGSNNLVSIDHGGGITTEYGHMSSVAVTSGQQVNAGDVVGAVGSEGYSTGPHLHFIVNEAGVAVDPVPFYTSRGVNLGVDDPAQPVGSTDAPATSDGTAPPSQVGPDEVRIIQTNVPRSKLSDAEFVADINKAASFGPDFITLNEVYRKPARDITPTGYSSWRAGPIWPVPGSQGTALAWRNDKWTLHDKGRIRMTSSSSSWLDNRWAHWVTLKDSTGAAMSVVSAHAMPNPRNSGAARQAKYRSGMIALNSLISDLSGKGPVLVGGDFNSWAPKNGGTGDPWGPTAMLAKADMKSTFAALGQPGGVGWATHRGGGTIDYVFYQANNGLTPISHRTYRQNSDHHGLLADFKRGEVTGDVVSTSTSLPDSFTANSSSGESVTLDAKQIEFAAQIAAKGAEMAVPDDGIVVAFMTVFVETKFKNYASDVYPNTIGDPRVYPSDAIGSDHDSVGLFQQRPQSGWGDPGELLDVNYAASAFFGGPQGPNGGSPRGLLDLTGWESMPKGNAAQSVQVSAHPERYAYWESAATDLLAAVKGAYLSGGTDCVGALSNETGGFTVGTLNVLGHHHTEPGGSKASWRASPGRMEDAVEAIDSSGASVVALQEFEGPQLQVVRDNSEWDVFPSDDAHNDGSAVMWRADTWTFKEGHQFDIRVPNNRRKKQSYVLLENKQTGQGAYFISVHNPSDYAGDGSALRAAALDVEKTMVQRLKGSGHPVFLAGDFNDSRGPFCALGDLMVSANGAGKYGAGCRPPGGSRIDQVFAAGSQFSGVKVDTTLKDRRISDHPLVLASVGASSGNAQTAIDYALQQVGKGYSQAAGLRMGPTHFDCSGLMYMAWKQAGVTLGTYTGTQQNDGTEVSRSQLQPGDLIFYYSPVSHVAMYIGERDGVPSIVHAANPRDGVEVAPLSEMERDIVSFRRVG